MDEKREQETWSSSTVYPLRTSAQEKNRANKLKARDGEERTSPFVTFSWVIIVFDLLFVSSFEVLVQQSNGTEVFFNRFPFAFHLYWLTRHSKVQRGRERVRKSHYIRYREGGRE